MDPRLNIDCDHFKKQGKNGFLYINKDGDVLDVNEKSMILRGHRCRYEIDVDDVVDILLTPSFKSDSKLYVKGKSSELVILVDTETNGFSDLPTLYKIVKRHVALNRR